MTQAIRIEAVGGPDVLNYVDVSVAEPGDGEVRLRQTAIGLNYMDVNHRTGVYPLLSFPAIIGVEGAGVIEEVGLGVSGFVEGDRVAYCLALGAYATHRIIAASQLNKLPAYISDEEGAAGMVKGLTAQYLLNNSYAAQAGDTILVHAAAGGVGSMLCQWAKHLGVTVLGTVGSDQKTAYAAARGCDHPILYRQRDFAEQVREITGGSGVNAVYDGIGKDTFDGSLDALADFGTLVCYGEASGPVDPVDIRAALGAKAAKIARGSLVPFAAAPERRAPRAKEFFQMMKEGVLKVDINQRYELAEAAQAHRDLEGRKTLGSSVIIP